VAGAAFAVLCAVETVLLFDQPGAPWVLALFPAAAGVWFAAGAVATARRPGNRMGPIMLAGGLTWLVAGLANAPQPALAAVGVVVAVAPLAIVAHLLHAFPSGRLRGTASRAIVAGLYGAALLLQAPAYLFQPNGAGHLLQLADRPDLVELGRQLQDAVGGGLMVATAVLLAVRLRAATSAQRRVLAPLAGYGIAAVVLVPLLSRLRDPLLGGDPIALFTAQIVLVGLVPVAFAAAMLRGGFAPTAGVQELSAVLGAGRVSLRDALAEALGDRSVELVVWAEEPGRWVDGDGRPVELPDPRSGRGVVPVTTDGRRVGAIVYDGLLFADAAPVRDAARVIALALDRERLTAELRASRDGLRRSRARIAAAADDERRRIARDLHDGVQGRLVLLALRAGELEAGARGRPPHGGAGGGAGPGGGAGAARAEWVESAGLAGDLAADAAALRRELETTLRELRELVHGVLPSALVESGLAAAVDDLADRMPLPTTVDAIDERFPEAVESACWFVVAEALANAVKHADATALRVRVGRAATRLRVEVHDDGRGGADPAGSGLRGLADRVDVLGGTLTVDSPPGGGTRIVAEVPCGS
jgi:signal transduction histidine kinase